VEAFVAAKVPAVAAVKSLPDRLVGGLACAGQKSVVAAWSALRDELRLVPIDDLTDFDAKATPSHRVTWRHPGDSASGLAFLDRRNPAAVGADQASVSLGADAGDDQGGVPSQWVDWRLFPLIRRHVPVELLIGVV